MVAAESNQRRAIQHAFTHNRSPFLLCRVSNLIPSITKCYAGNSDKDRLYWGACKQCGLNRQQQHTKKNKVSALWCSGQGWQLLTFIGVNHRPWSQPTCRDHKWTNSNLCVQKSAFVQSSAYRFCSECSMPIRWQIVEQSSKTGYYSNSCLIAWVAAKDYQKYSSRLRRTRRRTGHFKLSYLACLAGPSIILLHLVVSGCGIDTMLWLWWQHFWHKKATHFGCCRTAHIASSL